MKLFKIAYRSLIGNGLKTWLNVFVLSISFVLIIFMQGLLEGWSRQAVTDAIDWEIGDGQFWAQKYDPYDPFTLDSCSQKVPANFKKSVHSHRLEPILISQGSIYPHGRVLGTMLKGIHPSQTLLKIPTQLLAQKSEELPVIMGAHFAKVANVKVNDVITLRWRDVNGTFEAIDIKVVGIFKTTVPTIDNGQIWMSLTSLQKMMSMDDYATIVVKSPEFQLNEIEGWGFHGVSELTQQTIAIVQAKSVGMSIFYTIFLLLALIAIFDTQTLSIFRRQREIGTLVALGMTQRRVVQLFTLEGTMNAVLAILLGGIYGAPFFIYFAMNGLSFPVDVSDFGIPVADKMYPVFTLKLILGTVLFILFVTAVVSYLPAKKIAKMNPTDAIRGKVL